MSLDDTKRFWSELAELDPMWAVLSQKEKRNQRWEITDFFASGETEVGSVMHVAESLGLPRSRKLALDFGCGVGRLTRAMAAEFDRCIGIDISPQMIELARTLNNTSPNAEFRVNEGVRLMTLEDRSCDFVYSNRVLQHLPSPDYVQRYLSEFFRVLSPGGLVCFGFPQPLGLRYRVAPSRAVFPLLRRLRIPAGTIYKRLGMFPAPMLGAGPASVERWIRDAGGSLVKQVAHDEGVAVYFAVPSGTGDPAGD